MTTPAQRLPETAVPPAPVPFDASALIQPIDQAELQAYARQVGGSSRRARLIRRAVIMVVTLSMVGIVMMSTLSSTLAATGGRWTPSAIAQVVFMAVMLVVFVVPWRLRVPDRIATMLRLDRFARANGMSYQAGLGNPALPGMIFGIGHSRQSLDLVRGLQPRFVEFANYRYTTGKGNTATVHKWGYVAVKLGAPLPHIVLDAVGNNGLTGSNLPMAFDKGQRLSLEGDFDRHFALYCPEGYERDALYLFTPDIMARFVDNAAALDVEIVDDWLFLYAKRDFSTLDPATWAWLFSVVGALLDKFAQWERWRDDRSGAPDAAAAAASVSLLPFAVPAAAPVPPLIAEPQVAPQGRRLGRTFKRWPVVLIGGFVALWLLIFLTGVISEMMLR
ncbi:hypothetical protein [Agromyces larvae]|uniref:DUF3137 domain-containing protein n=1 Tax=Agromyces larvae TaxID=2929802 RepID=A0ABY4BZZ5_9MICO|nr:hypothetical protein [Agromyces larvae]UOE43288.1 hypothetical protein MTO99_13995 [Agromyces larvae]